MLDERGQRRARHGTGPAASFLFLALGLACLPCKGLEAWGGDSMNWLGGTQPWDSTPYKEMDVQLAASAGRGLQAAAADAQWGILDELQFSGQYALDSNMGLAATAGAPATELDLRLREPDFPDWRPAFSVYARAPYVGQVWQGWGGLAADMEPWDGALAGNAEMGDGGQWRLRLALWTPYLATALRVGAEASWLNGAAEAYIPQILLNGPGDLSLQLGARLDAQGGQPLWTARLSYQLFPSP